VDLNGDGHIDVLSGSYSRTDGFMAGLFQVLWGSDKGFAPATTLNGSDGEPLLMGHVEDVDGPIDQQICTRPFAADLDGDGKLDIVSGNFGGTFAWFRGEGKGRFAPKAMPLLLADGSPMQVAHHSDPFLVDWDGDGDLDLLSGADDGSVQLFRNDGDANKAAFTAGTTLLAGHEGHGMPGGAADAKRPSRSVRIAAADVDGDGKLDLLLGDATAYTEPVKGIDAAEFRKREAAWQAKMQALEGEMPELDWEDMESWTKEQEAKMEAFQQKSMKLYKERSKFAVDRSTGHVWLLRQK